MTLQMFFKAVSEKIATSSGNIWIFMAILAVIAAVFAYYYLVNPRIAEYRFQGRMLDFIFVRHNLEDYEFESINGVAQRNGIFPSYSLYISQSLFEKYEHAILESLKENCPPGVSARETVESLKERLFD